MSTYARPLLLLTLCCCSFSTQAEDAKDEKHERPKIRLEFQERIHELTQEVGQAMRNGKLEEAHELRQEIRELMQKEAMQQRGPKPPVHDEEAPHRQESLQHFGELLRRSHELRMNGKHDEAQKLSAEIRELGIQLHQNGNRPPIQISEEKKIQHLHEAAEKLEAGGFLDEARDLHERAEHLEHALREHQREEHGHQDGPRQEQIEQVRHEMHELHEMMQQLQQQTRKLQQELEHVKKELTQSREKQRVPATNPLPEYRFQPPYEEVPPQRKLETPKRKMTDPPKADDTRAPTRTFLKKEFSARQSKEREAEPNQEKTSRDVKE